MSVRLAVWAVMLFAEPADDWRALRDHVLGLMKALEAARAPLPVETAKALDALLARERPDDPAEASRRVQELLDAQCLLTVHVNPESRVKAARGPRRAELMLGRASFVLVKVSNEGGVTHDLSVDGPQLSKGEADDERWLEASVQNAAPFTSRLSGGRVEYRALRLVARRAGRREATLGFDVGQGSQDLGFRAEVPVLFAVGRP